MPAIEQQEQLLREPPAYLSIQCRLTVGAPDDPLEREADAMADTIMRMPAEGVMSFSRSSSVQRKCAACEDEEEVQRKPLASFIQRKSNEADAVVSDSVADRINSSKGSGSGMDSPTQSFMESRFEADFSDVRIHTGSYAADLSNDLSAQAFTLGNDIYFNSGKYDPSSDSGKHLLAHELTHTIQQQGSIGRKIQRTSVASRVHGHLSAMVGGVLTPDFTAALAVLGGLNLTDLLETTNDLSIADIRSLLANLVAAAPNRAQVSIALRVAQLNSEPLNVSLAQSGRLVTDIAALPDAEALQVNRYLNRHQSRATLNPDLIGRTSGVTPREHGNVDAILNPGATVSVSGSGAVTVSGPSPGPGCGNGTYATQMRAAVVPLIQSRAAAFNALRAAPAALPIASMAPIANVAQQEVEAYFAPYLNATTRGGSGFRLGSATAASLIRDQSTTAQWRTQDGRRGWVQYWMNTDGESVNNTHHCDAGVFETVKNNIADDPALQTDIDDTINSWPAEATNGIHLQPFVSAAQLRSSRWDVFTTIIHEYIHVLKHPNFEAAEGQLNPSALQILKEGVDDLLRRDLWDASGGNLSGRVARRSYAPQRVIIEGGSFPYDSTQVIYHPDYPQIAQARQIARQVGMHNVKSAYFLGHVELLGLGQGSLTDPGHSLTNIGMWTTNDYRSSDWVTVLPGETLRQLQARLNANTVLTTAGNSITLGAALPATVKVPGVRTVVVLSGESLTHIANINGVTVFELMRANNLTGIANPAVGTRLLIPRH